ITLAGSVQTESAHECNAREKDKTRRSDLRNITLISDFRETAGARQLLLWNCRHVREYL
ncbi:hypothetical protein BX616_002004, partial [Lobosporangium transversale]